MHYNVDNYGSILKATEAIMGDAFFTCPALKFAAETSSAAYPTYVYRFDLNLGPALAHLGAAHAAEIPYVFGVGDNGLLGIPIEPDPEHTAQVQALWAHFARHGEPPAELGPPMYDPAVPRILLMAREWLVGIPEYGDPCEWLQVEGL